MTNAIIERAAANSQGYIKVKHPMIRFTEVLDQLKAEHELLRSTLQEFATIDEDIRAGRPDADWFGTLSELKERTVVFQQQLEEHSQQEDTTIFPTVSLYMEEQQSAIEHLEEDHRMAVQYMQDFNHALSHSVAPLQQADAATIMQLLMKARHLLLEHFSAEEKIIYSLAEEIVDDIDYLSC